MLSEQELRQAEAVLGHEFTDPELLRQALMHASLADARLKSNERLEFLGDAVLGMVVCEYLYDNFQDLLEGELTKIKSSVVSRKVCADVAEARGLSDLLKMGKGLSMRSLLPSSVSAAVYESLIGALYLDAGLDTARKFILEDLEELIDDAARSGHQYNFKSVLQQVVQQDLEQTPQYILLDEQGPDHAKCFEVCVQIGTRRFSSSWGASKKQAEQQAALEALSELGYVTHGKNGEVRVTADREPADVQEALAEE